METIQDKKVYKCSFCGKLSLSKGAMTVHEMNCKKNPKNCTDCASCVHLIHERKHLVGTEGQRCKRCPHHYVDYGNYGYSECTREDDNCDGSLYITDFICEKTDKKMYYEKKVRMMSKEKREEIISRCDCVMPVKCDMFEDELFFKKEEE